MNTNTKNSALTKTEILENRKDKLMRYRKDISKHHINGKTWDIWRDLVAVDILIEEINIELSKEVIRRLKHSIETYKNY